MKLEKFRINHFRSIKDSGWVHLGQRAVLVGRNESGKSNLLLALRTLKSSEKLEPLSLTRDFPADVSRSKYSSDMSVVRTVWLLSDAEKSELASLFPRARNVSRVEVGRGYESAECWVRFDNLVSEGEARGDGSGAIQRSAGPGMPIPSPTAPMPGSSDPSETSGSTSAGSLPGLPDGGAIAAPATQMDGSDDDMIGAFASPAPGISSRMSADATEDLEGVDAEKAARDWVIQKLPTFVFLDEYPDIDGHQNLVQFLKRQTDKTPLPGDEYFEKLLVAAEIDPRSIDKLLTADSDTRRQIMNLAGGIITTKLRELWSDRALKVRFDLDGEEFHTLVSDPHSVYDVEINLSARSRGFRWFFSFYTSFAADAKSGDSNNTILLLDEPGLHLHPLGQRDLLEHLAADFDNQVVLTTQSPFLVPGDDLASVRTVNISEKDGTTVSHDCKGDAKTVFPLRHALAAEMCKKMFDDGPAVVVEELSDLWYLRGVSNLMRERGEKGIPSHVTLYPSAGSASVLHMAALLGDLPESTVVLRSQHPTPEMLDDPAASALMPASNVIYLADPEADAPATSADVEDLLDPRIFDQLVRNAYKTQLGERQIEPDESEPRIVQRYEAALARVGLRFSRDRVARVFLRAISQSPDAVLPDGSRDKFERLFSAIRTRVDG